MPSMMPRTFQVCSKGPPSVVGWDKREEEAPGQHETPRVHHASRRRGGGVAARGASAAAGDTGGFLNGGSPDGYAPMVPAVHQGLMDTGYVEAESVRSEHRWTALPHLSPLTAPKPQSRDE